MGNKFTVYEVWFDTDYILVDSFDTRKEAEYCVKGIMKEGHAGLACEIQEENDEAY